MNKFKAILTTAGLIAGLVVAPVSAMAHTISSTKAKSPSVAVLSTSYEWAHYWDFTGTGVTIQDAANGFSRTSYVHSTTCTEEWFKFWPSGNVAMYYRHSSTSSCSGVAWLIRWNTASGGTTATLSWQHDGQIVLRNGNGSVVFASGRKCSFYCNGEGIGSYRQLLGTNSYWYIDNNEVVNGLFAWVNWRTYPSFA